MSFPIDHFRTRYVELLNQKINSYGEIIAILAEEFSSLQPGQIEELLEELYHDQIANAVQLLDNDDPFNTNPSTLRFASQGPLPDFLEDMGPLIERINNDYPNGEDSDAVLAIIARLKGEV